MYLIKVGSRFEAWVNKASLCKSPPRQSFLGSKSSSSKSLAEGAWQQEGLQRGTVWAKTQGDPTVSSISRPETLVPEKVGACPCICPGQRAPQGVTYRDRSIPTGRKFAFCLHHGFSRSLQNESKRTFPLAACKHASVSTQHTLTYTGRQARVPLLRLQTPKDFPTVSFAKRTILPKAIKYGN